MVVLTKEAYAIGCKLIDLQLAKHGVVVTRLRRGEKQIKEPSNQLILREGDVLVLYGHSANIELAERLLLEGNY